VQIGHPTEGCDARASLIRTIVGFLAPMVHGPKVVKRTARELEGASEGRTLGPVLGERGGVQGAAGKPSEMKDPEMKDPEMKDPRHMAGGGGREKGSLGGVR